MEHKELNLVKGIPVSFEFEALDETGLPYDLDSTNTKFEVRTSYGKLVLTKLVEESTTINLSAADTLKLGEGNHSYRLVLQTLPNSVPYKELFRGVIAVEGPIYDSLATENNNVQILSNGTIYPTTAITLEPGVWYAVASFFRFTVAGQGIVSLDGRDIHGNITGNLASFVSADSTERNWYPNMGSNPEFRLNNIVSSPTVRYLP